MVCLIIGGKDVSFKNYPGKAENYTCTTIKKSYLGKMAKD